MILAEEVMVWQTKEMWAGVNPGRPHKSKSEPYNKRAVDAPGCLPNIIQPRMQLSPQGESFMYSP